MTDRPDKVTVFEGGFVAGELDFTGGEAFWSRLEELGTGEGPAEHLDVAMGGKPAPRTWLFLHPPGRGEMSTAAALSFARALAERDQSSLVLDGDEVHGALTEWIGRKDQEGWIDLARYGTSVLTSGLTLPFSGRRGYVMGVGSFTPTDVTPEEIKALMARLRRQADDILVTAPADAFGLAWAAAADARILCWDPATLSRIENDELTVPFADADVPVTGVMAFGEIPPAGVGAPEDQLVEDVLAESEEEEPDHEGFPVPEEEARDEQDESAGLDQQDDDEDWGDPGLVADDGDEETDPGRKTSGVFLFGAVAAVLVIAVAFAYWYKVLRVPSEGPFENVPAVASNQMPERPATTTPLGSGSARETAEALADTSAGSRTTLTDGAETVADTMAATAGETAGGTGTDDAVARSGETVEDIVEETTGQDAPAATADTPADGTGAAVTAAFDMAPFSEPVGRDGWALHVYSLPSMDSMQDQLKELERRGFKTAVKAVDVEGKGRWYRVYLGNFASRAARPRRPSPACWRNWARNTPPPNVSKLRLPSRTGPPRPHGKLKTTKPSS
jgi:hypothetical protein